MATDDRQKLLDIITTILLFSAGAVGLYLSLGFPGRAGMWPTFVMSALLVFAGLHLFNLFRGMKQPDQQELGETIHQSEE